MCGIYLTNIPYDGKEINQKLDFMIYRGPENRGIFRADKLIFGHLRLKILDLDKRSNQPMHFKNLTIIFITHDLASARYLADRILVLSKGTLVEQNKAEGLIKDPENSYTKKLVRAASPGWLSEITK